MCHCWRKNQGWGAIKPWVCHRVRAWSRDSTELCAGCSRQVWAMGSAMGSTAKPAHHHPPCEDPVIARVLWEQNQGCSERQRAGKVKGWTFCTSFASPSSYRWRSSSWPAPAVIWEWGWSQGQQHSPSGQSGPGCSVWPWAVVPGWHWGASHKSCHHSGLVVPKSTSLTQNKPRVFLSLLMWNSSSSSRWALLCSSFKCAESCPTSPGIPCAGRGTSLPLEHSTWPNIPWSHVWQVYSLEFLVSLQQELVEKGRGHGRVHFVLICALLSACQCK